MSHKAKLHIEILDLADGWVTVEVLGGSHRLVIDASDVPQDSFGMLLEAVDHLLSGDARSAQVFWFLEPAEITFDLKRKGDDVIMGVSNTDQGDLFDLNLSLLTLCEEFLRVVGDFRELLGQSKVNDWSWPFPESKFLAVSKKIDALR